MDKIKKYMPLAVLILLIAGAYASGLHEMLNLETLQAHKGQLKAYVTEKPVMTAMGFTAAYLVAVALSLPVATLLTLLGGFLFGKWLGTLFVVLGATLGASIIFLIAKSSLGTVLREKAGPLYKKAAKNMEENAWGYLFFMRLVPVFPFVLVNIVPALFNVPLRMYFITTFFGVMPGTFVFVNVGETLGEIESLNDLVSLKTLFAVALFGVFALIPVIYKQVKARKATVEMVLFALALGVATPAQASDYNRFLTLYDGLLQDYVHQADFRTFSYNAVDYEGWAQDPRYKQARAAIIKSVPQDGETRDEEMAFWINTYNFLTIDLIVSHNENESIKNLGSFFHSPWEKAEWVIGDRSLTLDDIEHDILRPMGEARVHFAINCASLSCPDLRPESYRAERLDEQLENQARLTLKNHGKGFYYDNENDTAYVTKILDWFGDDFGDLYTWLQDYKPGVMNSETTIRFLPYDWSLNKKRTEIRS